jgi:hypothetical protein
MLYLHRTHKGIVPLLLSTAPVTDGLVGLKIWFFLPKAVQHCSSKREDDWSPHMTRAALTRSQCILSDGHRKTLRQSEKNKVRLKCVFMRE